MFSFRGPELLDMLKYFAVLSTELVLCVCVETGPQSTPAAMQLQIEAEAHACKNTSGDHGSQNS